MTPFCARILIFPCAALAAGIKATPGSSANGCGLWGVAWAWRQRATQPQETQPRLEPKSQCVHFVVSFTFFPLLAKKKKKNSCYKSQASSTPKAIAMWTKGRAGTRAGRAGGGRLGGQASVWVARLSVTQCKKGKRRAARTVAATLATYCVVTSGRRKTQNKFDVVSTTGWLQSCSRMSHYTTHWELRWKRGLLRSVSS